MITEPLPVAPKSPEPKDTLIEDLATVLPSRERERDTEVKQNQRRKFLLARQLPTISDVALPADRSKDSVASAAEPNTRKEDAALPKAEEIL